MYTSVDGTPVIGSGKRVHRMSIDYNRGHVKGYIFWDASKNVCQQKIYISVFLVLKAH